MRITHQLYGGEPRRFPSESTGSSIIDEWEAGDEHDTIPATQSSSQAKWPCALGQELRQPYRLYLLEIDENLNLDYILVTLRSWCISVMPPPEMSKEFSAW